MGRRDVALMNELAAQSLVIKALRQEGGFGIKMSNRFLAGVPDLMLCLRGHPEIGVFEVKIDEVPKRDNYITLKLTDLQEKFLRDLDDLGGWCGVISFLRDGHKLSVAAWSYEVLRYEDHWMAKHRVSTLGYTELKRGEREEKIVDILEHVYGQRV